MGKGLTGIGDDGWGWLGTDPQPLQTVSALRGRAATRKATGEALRAGECPECGAPLVWRTVDLGYAQPRCLLCSGGCPGNWRYDDRVKVAETGA